MPLSKLNRLLSQSALLIWASLLSVTISSLMISHWVALPSSKHNISAQQLVQVQAEAPSQLQVKHVLLQSCRCSRRVAAHLASRTPFPGVREQIVLVESGEDSPTIVIPEGFDVERLTAEELVDKYSIESAPLLLITKSSGELLYAGGYTSRKQGYEIRDQAIVTSLLRGEMVDELPVFGCAVSARLRKAVDPLGLKY